MTPRVYGGLFCTIRDNKDRALGILAGLDEEMVEGDDNALAVDVLFLPPVLNCLEVVGAPACDVTLSNPPVLRCCPGGLISGRECRCGVLGCCPLPILGFVFAGGSGCIWMISTSRGLFGCDIALLKLRLGSDSEGLGPELEIPVELLL